MEQKLEKSQKAISRRAYLAQGAIFAWVIQACKTKNKPQDAGTNTPDVVPLSEAIDTKNSVSHAPPDLSPAPKNSIADSKDCDKPNLIALEEIQIAKENLTCELYFYGTSLSTMIVLSLPKYQHGVLDTVILVKTTGEVIAQKGVFENSDINPDTTLKPMIFDHLALRGEKRFVVVFKSACASCETEGSYSKYVMPDNITYMSSFRGKPVYSASPMFLPSVVSLNQVLPFFQLASSKSNLNDQEEYIALNSNAQLMPVGLSQVVVTDLTGKVIVENGDDFKSYSKIPNAICYQLINNIFYVRTFIKGA